MPADGLTSWDPTKISRFSTFSYFLKISKFIDNGDIGVAREVSRVDRKYSIAGMELHYAKPLRKFQQNCALNAYLNILVRKKVITLL